MLLLDDTAAALDLLRGGLAPRAGPNSEPPEGDLRIWSRLGGAPGPVEAEGRGDFWKSGYVVDQADRSQFDAFDALLDAGAAPPAPAFAFALTGNGFHGHRGRPWTALRGNLHLSILLTPESFPARDALAFVMLPAVAAADAHSAATSGNVRPGIKWVNDLLVGGRKIAGVLAATKSVGDRLTAAILGIGVNVERAPRIRPTPFVPAVTSISRQPGCGATRLSDLARPLLLAIEAHYRELLASGPGPLREAYRSASVVEGRRVRIYAEGIDDEAPPDEWPAPLATGVVTGIGDDLALELEGLGEPVSRGRLAFADTEPESLARFERSSE